MQQDHHKSIKVKVALFFGYNGQTFQGMQYQKEHSNTIENILHKVLVDRGFILQSNAQELKKIKWSRAARTDKKVHALVNGISLKLQIYPQYIIHQSTKKFNFEKIINHINEDLPIDIRLFAIKKLGKSFDMRHDSNSRIYNYIVPVKLFQSYTSFKSNNHLSSQDIKTIIDKLNGLAKFYLGTHNFHNFTKGYKKTDPRCDRYMMSMIVQHVQAATIESYLINNKQQVYQDFIRFTLVGQSFIYHQIRKMIGLLIRIFAEELDGEQTIKKAFKQDELRCYLAPGQGLYLNRMTFDLYNNRKEPAERIQLSQDDELKINRFRSYLEQKIVGHQISNKLFSIWLTNIFEKQNQQKQESEDQKSDEN